MGTRLASWDWDIPGFIEQVQSLRKSRPFQIRYRKNATFVAIKLLPHSGQKVSLSYRAVRFPVMQCAYANELRRRRPRCGDKWHMDEVYLKINGKTHYLWRAVDQDGNVLDILVQSRRNKKAAKRFFAPRS
jgi:transposase-like protein